MRPSVQTSNSSVLTENWTCVYQFAPVLLDFPFFKLKRVLGMDTFRYLQEPELVAKAQKFFGVKLLGNRHTVDKDKEKEGPKYEVTNKFWYYLFVFGTALGDETFYACFIPFWFWNVDGAVGRRVVLVWALVMYVGKLFELAY